MAGAVADADLADPRVVIPRVQNASHGEFVDYTTTMTTYSDPLRGFVGN